MSCIVRTPGDERKVMLQEFAEIESGGVEIGEELLQFATDLSSLTDEAAGRLRSALDRRQGT